MMSSHVNQCWAISDLSSTFTNCSNIKEELFGGTVSPPKNYLESSYGIAELSPSPSSTASLGWGGFISTFSRWQRHRTISTIIDIISHVRELERSQRDSFYGMWLCNRSRGGSRGRPGHGRRWQAPLFGVASWFSFLILIWKLGFHSWVWCQ